MSAVLRNTPFPTFIAKQDLHNILKSEEDEKEKQAVAFRALANANPEKLVQGLDETLIKKVYAFAKQRKKIIQDFVLELNRLGIMKTDLVDENSSFEKYKQITQEITALNPPYYPFDIKELQKDAENLVPKVRAKFIKIESMLDQKVRLANIPSPHDDFQQFIVQINGLLAMTSNINQKFIYMYKKNPEQLETFSNVGPSMLTQFLRDLRSEFRVVIFNLCLVDEISFEQFKKYALGQYNDPSFIDIIDRHFEKEFASIQKESLKTKTDRNAQKKTTHTKLLEQLRLIQTCYEQVEKDPAYRKFDETKKKLFEELKYLKTFCKFDEILQHGAISRDSIDRVNKMMLKIGL